MKRLPILVAAAAVAAVLMSALAPPPAAEARVCIPNGPVQFCWDELPDRIDDYYGGSAGGPAFPWTIPGSTTSEAAGGGGGRGGAGGGGGSGPATGPFRTPVEDTVGYRHSNPYRAGEKPKAHPSQVTVHPAEGGTKAFWNAEDVGGHPIVKQANGVETYLGSHIEFIRTTETLSQMIALFFKTTGGDYSHCIVTGPRGVDCMLREPLSRHLGTVDSVKPAWTMLTDPSMPSVSTRVVPICFGRMVNGGAGVETVVPLSDLSCDASPDSTPTSVQINGTSTPTASGVPWTDPDGSLHFQPTADLGGLYTWISLTAVTADGIMSRPFLVGVRNHFAPAVKDAVIPDVEGITGTTTTIDPKQWFDDQDVDRYYDITGDRLTYEVVSTGAHTYATPKADGTLDVRVIDGVEGTADDIVRIRAVDSYGLRSEVLEIPVHISDVVPSCMNGAAATTAEEPVHIQLQCSISAPEGWHELKQMRYSIVTEPEFGTLSEFDPVAGVVLYTPDPAHPGPVTVGFAADNNGATRTAQFSIDVQPTAVG